MADHSAEPRATYRFQLTPSATFDDAGAMVGYLAALGISHLYTSPYLQATPGSTHGYDVLDHGQINVELGGDAGHARLWAELRAQGLSQLVDVVPNHMSIAGTGNRWWWDVLENGQASPYASYFDVDWQGSEAKLHDLVLLPILGDHYGRVLEAGEIQVERRDDGFVFRYHEHVLPIAPRSFNTLLATAAERTKSDLLAFLAEAFGQLPLSTQTDRASVTRRHRDKQVLRELLRHHCQQHPEWVAAIDQALRDINASPDALDALLDRQNYRVAFWRAAKQELDYRRFFDINTLVSLRIEDERVLTDTHALVFDWLHEGPASGLRIDHPDGLRDPQEYFQRLAQRAPQAWIVVEKILADGESIPAAWPVAGTTGYDFLSLVGQLYVDPAGEEPLSACYADFIGETLDCEELAHEKKHQVMRELFASDMNRLTAMLADICEQHRRYRDYSRRDLNSALREIIACFPVYRTYIRANLHQVTEQDERTITTAVEDAKRRRADLDGDLFDFVRDLLLLRIAGERESELVMRLQQCTGPVMAKGVEDTTFYCYNRLVALNDVGCDPGQFGIALADFHAACAERHKRAGRSLLASTTHDTKRSEDVRARLALLSEIPDQWSAAVRHWQTLCEPHRAEPWPDRNTEYLLVQTLVGAWPLKRERAQTYMEKAIREAKVHTSWTDNRPEYEAAIRQFIDDIYDDAALQSAVAEFAGTLVAPGRINSLAQTLLKLTAPGIPDIYQGTEVWNLSLTDPDNRRPVDYERLAALLAEVDTLSAAQIVARSDDGLPKLWLIRQALATRRAHPECFDSRGDYTPHVANGKYRDHCVSFLRGDEVLVVVPRLVMALTQGWAGTTLTIPPGKWRNQLTGEPVKSGPLLLDTLLDKFPVALLIRES